MLTADRRRRLAAKLKASRARLLERAPAFALLLMHLRYVARRDISSFSTDGQVIAFPAPLLDKLYEEELDYVLCHEILHLLHGHPWQGAGLRRAEYHYACDLIINCELKKLGFTKERYPHLGKVSRKLNRVGKEPEGMTAEEIYRLLLSDARVLGEETLPIVLIDSHALWGEWPGTCEPILEAAEGVPLVAVSSEEAAGGGEDGKAKEAKGKAMEKDGGEDEGRALWMRWRLRAAAAVKLAAKEGRDKEGEGGGAGLLRRMAGQPRRGKVDWRRLLRRFLQEDLCDYSFSPPDRRFSDTDFFLPDFNERETVLRNVLFMIDTSGSVNTCALSAVYSELRSAIEQMKGKLTGSVGFFDTEVVPPRPFTNEKELMDILPQGGGGTSFGAVFAYVREHYAATPPTCLVIFTDGYAPYPLEASAMQIPVLWIINNERVTPPWGTVVRVT